MIKNRMRLMYTCMYTRAGRYIHVWFTVCGLVYIGLISTNKVGKGFPIYSATNYAVAGYTKCTSEVGMA